MNSGLASRERNMMYSQSFPEFRSKKVVNSRMGARANPYRAHQEQEDHIQRVFDGRAEAGDRQRADQGKGDHQAALDEQHHRGHDGPQQNQGDHEALFVIHSVVRAFVDLRNDKTDYHCHEQRNEDIQHILGRQC